MELDWTTFFLEILNFLVLVWLLKRFLYKPVLDAIAQRKLEIEKRAADSQAIRQEADALRQQYERRIADWEQEKAAARSRLLEEVNAERTRLMAGVRAALEQEREKSRALEQRHLAELSRQAEETALSQGAQFVTLLLSRLSSAELEGRLVRIVLEDLRNLPEEQRQAIRVAAAEQEMSSTITSVYQIGPDDRQAIADALVSLIGRPVSCVWRQDPELKAGLHIRLGSWVLSANLRDELKFFREARLHAGATPTVES